MASRVGQRFVRGSGGPQFVLVIRAIVEKARDRRHFVNGTPQGCGRGGRTLHRASQPAADCLCLGVFRVIDPFKGARESEKRGGAGSMSGMGGWESGNSVAVGSTKVRTNSEGEMEEDCRDLW